MERRFRVVRDSSSADVIALSPSEYEENMRKEQHNRRVQRLLEVRKQENQYANKIRQNYALQKEAKDKEIIEDLKSEWENNRNKEIERITSSFSKSIADVGSGFIAAEKEESQRQAESAIMYREWLKNRQKEQSRYEQAYFDVRANQEEEERKKHEFADRRAQIFESDRQRSMKKIDKWRAKREEQQLAAKQAEEEKKREEELAIQNNSNVKKYTKDPLSYFQHTYYNQMHIEKTLLPAEGIQNAMDAAKFERELQEQKKSQTNLQIQERETKAKERFQKAKEQIQLEKEQEEVYRAFDIAAKSEREKRLAEVENAVVKTRTVEYTNNQSEKQRKMERMFEKELLVIEPEEPVVVTATIDGNVPVYTAETVYLYPSKEAKPAPDESEIPQFPAKETTLDDLFAVTVERSQVKKNKQVSTPEVTSPAINRAKTPPLQPRNKNNKSREEAKFELPPDFVVTEAPPLEDELEELERKIENELAQNLVSKKGKGGNKLRPRAQVRPAWSNSQSDIIPTRNKKTDFSLNDSDLFSVSSLSTHSLSDLADYDEFTVDQNKLFGQPAFPNEFSTKPDNRSLSISPLSSPSTARNSLSYSTLTPDREMLSDPLHPSPQILKTTNNRKGGDYRIEKPAIPSEGPAFQSVTAYDNVEPYKRQISPSFQYPTISSLSDTDSFADETLFDTAEMPRPRETVPVAIERPEETVLSSDSGMEADIGEDLRENQPEMNFNLKTNEEEPEYEENEQEQQPQTKKTFLGEVDGLDDSLMDLENKTNELLSLQERFEKYKADFLAKSQARMKEISQKKLRDSSSDSPSTPSPIGHPRLRPSPSYSSSPSSISSPSDTSFTKSPSSQLLERLARSTPTKISKKEMYALNSKNYEKLPEVKKMKAQQAEKEAIRQRKEKIKQMDRELREKRKKASPKEIM